MKYTVDRRSMSQNREAMGAREAIVIKVKSPPNRRVLVLHGRFSACERPRPTRRRLVLRLRSATRLADPPWEVDIRCTPQGGRGQSQCIGDAHVRSWRMGNGRELSTMMLLPFMIIFREMAKAVGKSKIQLTMARPSGRRRAAAS